MPQIIVTADHGAAFGEGAVTFRERVNVEDFESGHFATQLVERIGWAVSDADEVERVTQAEDADSAGDAESSGDAESADDAESAGDAGPVRSEGIGAPLPT